MACSGAHCTNHSTGTATCVGHRPPASSASPNVNAVVTSGIIYASHINALRDAIRIEIERWSQHAWYSGTIDSSTLYTPQGQGGKIFANTINDYDNKLHQVYQPRGQQAHGNPASVDVPQALIDVNKNVGDKIFASDYNTLVAQYNNLRADCICNSDCSCNAVCACHNNCDCNYSDSRLKKEIQYC